MFTICSQFEWGGARPTRHDAVGTGMEAVRDPLNGCVEMGGRITFALAHGCGSLRGGDSWPAVRAIIGSVSGDASFGVMIVRHSGRNDPV